MLELTFESTETLSQAEFADWLERRPRGDLNHYELLNGRVVMNPPAGYPHGEIEARLVTLLSSFVEARQLGRVLGSSQGFELPSGDTVEPDISFVSNDRWDRTGPHLRGKFLAIAPELVVEILSSSTASRDRGAKRASYERNGVLEYWLVDWHDRSVTAFHSLGGRFDEGLVSTEKDILSSRVLPGLSVSVAAVFR